MYVTFLESVNGRPLVKEISTNSVTPYPYVKEVNSHTHQVNDTADLYQHIVSHAALGHCLLKGNTRQKLSEESRAGQVDRRAFTDMLVLDLDGVAFDDFTIKPTYTDSDLINVAELVTNYFPKEFRNVSYIAQASASFGKKGNTVSMHILFMLTVPLEPKSIKLWLQNANFDIDVFRSQVGLAVNGLSLTYPLDVSVADNSKLIFIAPPVFNGMTDQFPDQSHRIVHVVKEHEKLPLDKLMAINPQQVQEKHEKLKDELRKNAGFKKKTTHLRTVNIENRAEQVITNPDRMSITISNTTYLPWVNCNINGGDSGAYYFNLDNPHYMFNFKGEAIFAIEDADPDFFSTIPDLVETLSVGKERAMIPLVMRDFKADIIYNGLYNPNINQFSDEFPLTPSSRQGVESFMFSHGRTAPDYIPDANIYFDPTTDTVPELNTIPYNINLYRKSKYMLDEAQVDKPLTVGEAQTLKWHCPTIYKVIMHILGDGVEEFEYFVNWLAFIYQTRQKAMTAWVLTGVQGTGKGLFYTRILRPLFGIDHVPMKSLQSIEEQFNSYMRQAIFMVVDEFHMASASAGASKMADKLKNQITEPTLTIRAMRSNQIEVQNYTNFIFLTNRYDAVALDTGDRRYNIAPRQETMLKDAHPDVLTNLKAIDEELYTFAGHLRAFKVNEMLVKTPIFNDAKDAMRKASISTNQEFFEAFKNGDLEYFEDVLQLDVHNIAHAGAIEAAKRFVKSWVAHADDEFVVIPLDHMKTVYNVMIASGMQQQHSPKQFSMLAGRYGLKSERKRPKNGGRDAKAARGVVVEWHNKEGARERLIEMYFDTADKKIIEV